MDFQMPHELRAHAVSQFERQCGSEEYEIIKASTFNTFSQLCNLGEPQSRCLVPVRVVWSAYEDAAWLVTPEQTKNLLQRLYLTFWLVNFWGSSRRSWIQSGLTRTQPHPRKAQ